MAGKYDFVIEQGIEFTRTVTWKDSAGNIVDLTGKTANLAARDTFGATILLLSDGSGLTLGGANGKITITIDAESTDDFTFDTIYYELDIFQDGVPAKRLLKGVITLDAKGSQ